MRAVLLALTLLSLAPASSAWAQDNPRPGGKAGPAARPATDPVVEFSRDDPELKAAMKAARDTLPIFWTLFDTDPVVKRSGIVKMAFPIRGGGSEHMWLRDLERKNGAIYGTLDNYPAADVGVREGDRVKIDPALITDWSYVRAGRMYGGYTTRAMLKQAPPEIAEGLLRVLSDRPLEGSDI